jgi:uncharacterized membrane protein YqjE
MKNKLYYIIPIAVVAIIISRIELVGLELRPLKEIQLSTLFMTFPIILALTERFNEFFVLPKKEPYIKEEIIKNTSLASFIVGLFLAIAGFRILETFMTFPINFDGMQIKYFEFIDVILTATVIAGGTDGWHQLVALLSDLTKAKRKEVRNEIV